MVKKNDSLQDSSDQEFLSKKKKRKLRAKQQKQAELEKLKRNEVDEKLLKKERIRNKVKEKVQKIKQAATEVVPVSKSPTTAQKRREELHKMALDLATRPSISQGSLNPVVYKPPNQKLQKILIALGLFFRKIRLFLIIFLAVFGICVIATVSLYMIYGKDLPDVSQLKNVTFAETTTIYDREGNILYQIYKDENRDYVPLDKIDKDIINATIAIEDKNFYKHFGFDPVGIIRAQLNNINSDDDSSSVQGASTITQQLAKNLYLKPDRTLERKIKELILSLQIEWHYDKKTILEMYLNKIPYGSNAYGIEAAAKTFFGKSADDVNLVEASVLASLPNAPAKFSPYGPNLKELMGYCKSDNTNLAEKTTEAEETPTRTDLENPEDANAEKTDDQAQTEAQPEASKEEAKCESPYDSKYVWGRKDLVMKRMVEDKYITEDQFLEAWKEGLKLEFKEVKHIIKAPHFVFYVREYLEKKYGKELVESGGLAVYTTLDPKLQDLGQQSIDAFYDVNLNRYGANNGAMIAIDPKTGQILAMVGSKDYWDEKIQGQVNVTTSLRQPGSAFKPLVYAAAIDNAGIGSGTFLNDYKTKFNDSNKVPNNYDGKFLGKMTIRKALGGSRNVPAIKAFYVAGDEEKILDFMDKLGMTYLRAFKVEFNKQLNGAWTFNYGWPLAIGSGEVKLLDLTAAYATMGNQGKYIEPNPILEVRDRNGNLIEKFDSTDPKFQGKQVMSADTAFIVSDMLADPFARPAGTWRNILTVPGHTVAAKTGTSDKKIGKASYPNNTLTVGYSPQLAAGFWVGNTDGKVLRNSAYSLYTTDPLWNKFMKEALANYLDEPFYKPDTVQQSGKEYYPGFWNKKDYDKMFKRMDAGKKDCNAEERRADPDGCKTAEEQAASDAAKKNNAPELPKNSTKPAIPTPAPIAPEVPRGSKTQ